MTALAGWELVYGKCNRCGTRTETLFADGPIRFWAGQATCEHGPHERPPLHDPRVRRAVKKAAGRAVAAPGVGARFWWC